MEIIGLIISITAILVSLFTYFKHDRKLKEQSKILNDYYIKRITQEQIDSKKAIIEASVITGENGTRIIKVCNKGKNLARNVNVIFPDIKAFEVFKNPCPIDIRPQNAIEIRIVLYLKSTGKIDLTFEWSDDNKETNIEVQTVQI